MNFALMILLAFVLDLIFGDPKWLFHPVNLIAKIAKKIESLTRSKVTNLFIAGGITTFTVLMLTGLACFAIINVAYAIGSVLGDCVSVYFMYASLATNGLAMHALDVKKHIINNDLDKARESVSMIVGRDTKNLEFDGVARASVESVGENMVDGVIAPLVFMTLFGPIGAMVFKAASTMDSLFGYKNEKYLEFGFFPAKTDDVLTFIPARLSVIFTLITGLFLMISPTKILEICKRDCRKHPSPNSAFGEVLLAIIMNRSLGGEAIYNNKIVQRPILGDGPIVSTAEDIGLAVRSMFYIVFIATMICSVGRFLYEF